jgi:hypothetical protein
MWQRLFDAVKVRMQGIYVVNGYETDIGAHCFTWRDLTKHPLTEAECPCIALRDPTRDTSPQSSVITAHDHTLTIEVAAAAIGSVQAPPDNLARRILCDIDKAIGQDRQWTVDGVKLARDTLPGQDRLETAHVGDRIVGVTKTFTIIFRTRQWDPFNQ